MLKWKKKKQMFWIASWQGKPFENIFGRTGEFQYGMDEYKEFQESTIMIESPCWKELIVEI